MRHYARNIGDLAAATRGLDLLHRGAYDALLDAYYLREAPLPLDRRECYLLADARTLAERRAVDSVIARFFTETPDGWRQKRCDAEIARWYEKSEKARESSAIAVKVRQANARHIATERSSNGQPNDAPNDAPNGHLPTTHDPRPTTHTPTVPPPSATEPPGLGGATAPLEPPGPAPAKTRRTPAAKPDGREAKSTPVWQAYCDAYFARYGVEPVRNAKANSLLAQLVDRLGPDAPHVAGWFVRSNRGLYVAAKHAPDLLLRDAEGLRTEWATGTAVTDTQARQADRTAATGNVFNALRSEVRNGTDG